VGRMLAVVEGGKLSKGVENKDIFENFEIIFCSFEKSL
jgi:hypothetical protein